MKFKHLLAIIIVAASLTNCSKSDGGGTYIPTPPDTRLELRITDYTSGLAASGTSVYLYSNATDWQNRTNAISIKTTDAAGSATFTGLSSIRYYWYAQLNCKNNLFLPSSTSSPITSQATTIVNAQIQGVGQLGFINTSSNPYRIFVDGAIVINSMPGSSTANFYFPSGFHTIRVLQLSGYIISPTDQTYTGTLACGGTLTTTFP